MVLAVAVVVSTHWDQTHQQNAESKRQGLCVTAAPKAILDHSSLGREAIPLPAAEMAGARAFSCCAVFVLFLFLFCYLRDSWKRPAFEPAAVPGDELSAPLRPAEQCPLLHTTAAARSSAEPRDINRRKKIKSSHLTRSLIPTKHLPRCTVLMGALPERNRRFSCLDPTQTTDLLFAFSLCHFQS